jgi:hypothetical protein
VPHSLPGITCGEKTSIIHQLSRLAQLGGFFVIHSTWTVIMVGHSRHPPDERPPLGEGAPPLGQHGNHVFKPFDALLSTQGMGTCDSEASTL